MNIRFKLILANLLLLLILSHTAPVVVQAQVSSSAWPVILTDIQAEYPLGRRLEFLADPTRQLTFEQISSPAYTGQFVPNLTETLNLGYTASAYWVRFQVRNEASQVSEWELLLGNPRIDYIDLYLSPTSGQSGSHKRAGRLLPFVLRDVPYHQFIFKLPLEQQTEQTIYLRFESRTAMILPLTLWLPEALALRTQAEMFSLGLLYGGMLAMIGYYTFLGLTTRDRGTIYYVILLLGFVLNQAARDGLTHQYLWSSWPSRYDIQISGFLTLIALLIFTVEFLATRRRDRALHRLTGGGLFLLGLSLLLIPFVDFLTVWQAIITPLVFLVVGLAGWRAWRHGYVPALYFLLASPIPTLSSAILLFTNLGLLPANGLTQNVTWFLGISLILFLSLALGNRINLLKVNMHKTNQELRRSQQQLRAYSNELEDRVARRTAELEQNQALLQALVEHAPTGILVKDRQGRYILVNQQAAAYSYRTPEEMLGRTVSEVFPLDVVEATERHDQEAIRGRETIKRELVTSGQGGKQTFYTFRFPIFDQQGDILGVGLFSLDITERKQVEATARRLAKQRQDLLEVSQSILSALTLAEVVEQVQQITRKLVEHNVLRLYWLDEEAGQLYPLMTSGAGDTEQKQRWLIPWGQGIISEVIRSGQAELVNLSHLDPRSVYPKPGRPPLEHAIFVPIQIKARTCGALAISRLADPPFTQEEFELAQLYVTQIAIAIHNARLFEQAEQARRTAEEANQAKSRFLANISHELRTPLNVILGYMQLFKQEPGLTPQQRAWLTTTHQSGLHLLTLINDILDLAKVEAGRIELVQTEFHLPTFLKMIVDMIQVRAETKQITFIFQPYDFSLDQATDRLPADIYGDETRLRQVLINLLGNAVKFTQAGTVTFKVGLVVSALAPVLRFQVEDTGPGIDPNHLELIFEPFQQLGPAKQQLEGTGLGLTISHSLLEQMGSRLYVTSKLDQGSSFWFDLTLPQISSQVVLPATAGISRITRIKDRRPRIMVVDDIAENRTMLAELLSPFGFEVMAVSSGREVLTLAPAFQPEAFIIDLVMPEMDGYELAGQLRVQPAFQQTLIIALSASAFAQDQQRSLAVGCNEFMAKPVELAQLLAWLEGYLGLEWLSAGPQPVDEMAILDPELLIPPPEFEIRLLHEMALIGDINGVLDQLARIEEMDVEYYPFAHQLRHLTESFEIAGMQAFIDQYMKRNV